MSILYGTKINQLLANTAPTGLLFADWLKNKDYSVQLQKKYRDFGWLTAICKGVMCRTGSRLKCLALNYIYRIDNYFMHYLAYLKVDSAARNRNR